MAWAWALTCAWAGGVGCGGGGAGGAGGIGIVPGTSISASPPSLSFAVGVGGASQTGSLRIDFVGDGVVAGYAPGVPQPQWLTVGTGTVTATTATFTLSASASFVGPGHYETSVRFATGRLAPGADLSQATQVVYFDVPVTMDVSDFAVTPSSIVLSAIHGSGAPPQPASARSFAVTGNGGWTASSRSPWLTLLDTSGTAPSTLGFAVNTDGLGVGVYAGNIDVTDTATGSVVTATVDLTVTAADIVLGASTVAFTLDGGTTRQQLSRTLAISDQLGGTDATRGVPWMVQSVDVPWLAAVAPASGTTAPPASLSLTLDAGQLDALANGDHAGTLTLAYTTEDGQSHTARVGLALHLAIPRVQWVAPYVVYTGHEHELVVRGTGFGGEAGQPLLFGATVAMGATPISDTELRVPCPTLPPGDATVQIPNALGVDARGARLVVRDAVALPGATVEVVGRKSRVFFDDERRVLYGADMQASAVHRLGLQAGAWAPLAPISVTSLSDAALSPDGRTLTLVTLGAGIYEVDVASGSAPQRTVQSPQLFSSIGFTNHGLAVVTTSIMGSGFTPVFTYDLATRQTAMAAAGLGGIGLYIGRAYATGDGREVLLSQNGLSPPPTMVAFDSSTDRAQNTPISENINQVAVSRDASRLVVDGVVYDRAYNPLGSVSGLRVIVSPDGDRAYATTYDSRTGTPTDIAAYDLSSAPGAGKPYPQLASIPLSPLLKQSPDAYPPMLALSSDGLTLFAWGGTAVQIIPLQ